MIFFFKILHNFYKVLYVDGGLQMHTPSGSLLTPLLYCIVFVSTQIVSMGLPGVNPAEQVGKYVKPKDWNKLISDPNTVCTHYSIPLLKPL